MGGGSGAGGGGGANRRNRVEISRWRRAVLLVPIWNCMSERCGTGGTGTGRRESGRQIFVRENKLRTQLTEKREGWEGRNVSGESTKTMMKGLH